MTEMKKKSTAFKTLLIDFLLASYLVLCIDSFIFTRHTMENGIDWASFGVVLLIGLILGLILNRVSKLSIGKMFLKEYDTSKARGIGQKPYAILGLVILAVTFYVGVLVTELSFYEFFSQAGIQGATRIFTALLNPNFEVLDQGILAVIETIYMAFIATAFSLPFAFLLSFFAARNLMNGSGFGLTVYYVIRFFLNVSRSIEPLVWAIIFSVWVGIGPFAGMLALMIHSVSSLAKLYSEQIENISEGPLEAMTATGAHPIQVIWYGVVPQVILPFLSFTIYRWDINVRMATVIGLVGGGGIGTLLMQFQGLARWNEVGLLIIIIAAVVWLMDFLSSKIRESIK